MHPSVERERERERELEGQKERARERERERTILSGGDIVPGGGKSGFVFLAAEVPTPISTKNIRIDKKMGKSYKRKVS